MAATIVGPSRLEYQASNENRLLKAQEDLSASGFNMANTIRDSQRLREDQRQYDITTGMPLAMGSSKTLYEALQNADGRAAVAPFLAKLTNIRDPQKLEAYMMNLAQSPQDAETIERAFMSSYLQGRTQAGQKAPAGGTGKTTPVGTVEILSDAPAVKPVVTGGGPKTGETPPVVDPLAEIPANLQVTPKYTVGSGTSSVGAASAVSLRNIDGTPLVDKNGNYTSDDAAKYFSMYKDAFAKHFTNTATAQDYALLEAMDPGNTAQWRSLKNAYLDREKRQAAATQNAESIFSTTPSATPGSKGQSNSVGKGNASSSVFDLPTQAVQPEPSRRAPTQMPAAIQQLNSYITSGTPQPATQPAPVTPQQLSQIAQEARLARAPGAITPEQRQAQARQALDEQRQEQAYPRDFTNVIPMPTPAVAPAPTPVSTEGPKVLTPMDTAGMAPAQARRAQYESVKQVTDLAKKEEAKWRANPNLTGTDAILAQASANVGELIAPGSTAQEHPWLSGLFVDWNDIKRQKEMADIELIKANTTLATNQAGKFALDIASLLTENATETGMSTKEGIEIINAWNDLIGKYPDKVKVIAAMPPGEKQDAAWTSFIESTPGAKDLNAARVIATSRITGIPAKIVEKRLARATFLKTIGLSNEFTQAFGLDYEGIGGPKAKTPEEVSAAASAFFKANP